MKVSLLSTVTYGIKIWGGDLKNSQSKVFEKGLMFYVKVCPYFVG